MKTRFFVRNRRDEDDEPKQASRKVYKLHQKLNSEQGLPTRTETRYVNGVPEKRLTLLPFPAGHENITTITNRLRLSPPSRI